jgi:hypothetical protein
MRFLKPLAAGLAVAIATTSFVGTADARSRHHHGDAFAAGAIGFAAGAFLSSLATPRYSRGYYYDDGYYDDAYYDEPGYYYAPAPRAYYPAPEPYYRSSERYGPCSSGSGTSRPAWAMC